MKKFLIGLITGIVLTGLALVIFAFSLLRLGERRPTIPSDGTLVLRLDGEIPEKAPVEIPIPFIGAKPPLTVFDIWSVLNHAAADPKIKGLVLITGHPGMGWGKAQQIRESLVRFRKSGKPVYAYLKAPRSREYYVATAAERIYIAPEDFLDIKGLRAELTYFRRTLDKLGVQVEIQHIGKYKDAGDMFTETGITPETKEVMDMLLDGIYGDLLNTMAQGRRTTPERVRALLDEGPFSAEQAKAQGLVDALRFEDQVYGEMKDRLKQGEIRKVAERDYAHAVMPAVAEGKRKVAILVGEGAIIRGSGEDAMGSDEAFSSGAFIRMVRRVAQDNEIAGVVLRVDSPGGDGIASDDILRELKLLRDRKPMVISMSDLAASGGYYVSMTGDPILAYPSTITGSIGVLYGKLNLRGLYDKLGISKTILTRGRNAAIDSDYQPLSPEGRQKMQKLLEDFYRGFVSKAAQARRVSYENLDQVAQGRVWLGSHARAKGLVDELGGLDRAVELVRQKARIRPDEKIGIVRYPPRRTIFEQWLKSASEPSVESKLRELLGFDYRVFATGGMLRVMPFQVNVQ
ncbi:MAG: signal peptide peptidase SppA [Acidobacteria bacterium]|nr:signal peptide peptidase SppA [Acidobacteriota bacterium]